MKTAMLILLSLIATISFAQVTALWRGNTPGHESKWDCPSNWSNNRVPDEFTDVIIQVDNSNKPQYPVLQLQRTEINSLSIRPGACIVVNQGTLYIMDPGKNYFSSHQIIGNGRIGLINDPHYVSMGDSRPKE